MEANLILFNMVRFTFKFLKEVVFIHVFVCLHFIYLNLEAVLLPKKLFVMVSSRKKSLIMCIKITYEIYFEREFQSLTANSMVVQKKPKINSVEVALDVQNPEKYLAIYQSRSQSEFVALPLLLDKRGRSGALQFD